METFTLNNGVKMPVLGLGTFPMHKFQLVQATYHAIRAGYVAFDTSAAYQNERALGWGLLLSPRKRQDVFITTKISNTQQYAGDVRAALKSSLAKLKVRYVDLYLMHWPVPECFQKTWSEMEKLYKEGLARAIGVCNFHQHHLEALLQTAEVMPAVNQVELHPLLAQKPLTAFCRQQGIQMEAYSPVARMDPKLVQNPMLVRLAEQHRKSVVQIILRWDYQHGIIAIPKSANPQRLRENLDIFDFNLSDQDMTDIDSLDQNYRVRYNPDTCDFHKL